MNILCRFINSGTGVDEGVFDVDCDAPFLHMGRPAMLVASPFGLGGMLRATFDGQGWVCDLD